MSAALDLDSYREVAEWFEDGHEISDGGSAWVKVDPDDPTIVARLGYYAEAYQEYAWACFNGDYIGPHIPVYYAIHEEAEEDGAICIMERLEPLDYDHVLTEVAGSRWSNAWIEYYGDGNYCDAIFEMTRQFPPEEGWIGHETITEDFLYLQAQLVEDGRALAYSIDIHDQNVMQRRDGTLVITDPWC